MINPSHSLDMVFMHIMYPWCLGCSIENMFVSRKTTRMYLRQIEQWYTHEGMIRQAEMENGDNEKGFE